MSYFKTTFNNTPEGGWGTFVNSWLDGNSVLEKHYTVTHSDNAPIVMTSKVTGMNYTISSAASQQAYVWQFDRHLSDLISSGQMTATRNINIQYGENNTLNADVFTFYDPTNFVNRTICHWSDNDGNTYTFHVYDSSTKHYASVATNNPDIAVTNLSFTFPVIKDFDLRTATNALNGGSDKYIIQPLVAFGMKTPIFLITGANGADVPLFSEIEAGGKSYFVIGSNYCVEI